MLFKIILFLIIAGSIAGAVTENLYDYFAYILTFNCFNAFALGGSIHMPLPVIKRVHG